MMMPNSLGRQAVTIFSIFFALACSEAATATGNSEDAPGKVTDLVATNVTGTSVTLQWTEVDDGLGAAPNYAIAFGSPTITWESVLAAAVSVEGTSIGATTSHTFENLQEDNEYQFQLAAYRGSIAEPTYGPVSNIVSATTTAPPIGEPTGVPFFEDNFDNGSLNDANGFAWGSSEEVTVDNSRSFSGSHSLRFRYGPDGTGNDSFSEQRFTLGRDLSAVWVDYMLYVPANFEHRNDAPQNNKFFMIWRDTYGSGSGTWQVGYEYTTREENTPNSILRPMSSQETELSVTSSGLNHPNHNSPFIGGAGPLQPGAWHRIRLEFKAASTASSNDGVMRLWVNTELVAAKTDGDFRNYENSPTDVVLKRGYFMGWANSGFTEVTDFFIDDVRFYASDPGWH